MCDVEDRLAPLDSRLEVCRVDDVGLEEYEVGVSAGEGPEQVHLGPVICISGPERSAPKCAQLGEKLIQKPICKMEFYEEGDARAPKFLRVVWTM